MSKDQARTALLGFNLVIGLLFLLFPRLSMRLYGLDPDTDRAAAYPVRYVGARSLVFAAMLADDEGSTALMKQLPTVAAVDGVANCLAGVTGEVPRRVAALGALTSAAAVAVGLAGRAG